MSSFNEIEMVVLAIVANHTTKSNPGMTASDVKNAFLADVHVDHMDTVLRHLEEATLIEGTGAGEQRSYCATDTGLSVVQAAALEIIKMREKILIRENKAIRRRAETPSMPIGLSDATFVDWHKWAAIATIVGIPLTIILWWLS